MTHFRKPRFSSALLNCISYFSGSTHIAPRIRSYTTKQNAVIPAKSHPAIRRKARSALTEYLHTTRTLPFTLAEHISKNSPHFLDSLLSKVNLDGDVVESVARHLRYNPINEFEPFFESLGLSPSELSVFLPQDIVFLSDDGSLMENYQVLCTYGVKKNKIGTIFKNAPEIFRYGSGILKSKLLSFEEFGLNRVTVVKLVCLSPHLLTGNVSIDFFRVLEKLGSIGIECEWIEGQLSKAHSFNWKRVGEVMFLLSELGFSEEQLRNVVCQNPEILFDASGHSTFSLIGFLLKFGLGREEIQKMFLHHKEFKVAEFARNLRNGYAFLVEIEMDSQDISNVIRSHAVLLGSCPLKKVTSLLATLNVGKRRVREMILTDPLVLKKCGLGVRVDPLPSPEEDEEVKSKAMKTKFLSRLGFLENSREMEEALKAFRGKGLELQERYDCLVNSGLKPEDATKMVRSSPHILNQSKEHIEAKIGFLKDTLGYDVSCLVRFPNYISYTSKRSMLRLSMYKWLRERGKAGPNLALSTLIPCSEKAFVKTYVNAHPGGPRVWEKLKKEIYTSQD